MLECYKQGFFNLIKYIYKKFVVKYYSERLRIRYCYDIQEVIINSMEIRYKKRYKNWNGRDKNLFVGNMVFVEKFKKSYKLLELIIINYKD